ncbi:HET-domain-containing protein [Apiospora sp. TS-2023a]
MDALCSRCAKIDWPNLIRQANSKDPSRLTSLRWIKERHYPNEGLYCLADFPLDTLKSACAICRLLSKTVDGRNRPTGGIMFTTKNDGFCGNADVLQPWLYENKDWGIESKPGRVLGLACRNLWDESVGIARLKKIDTRKADLALLRTWITDCDEQHGDACNAAMSELITSLRVIDLHTGLIETANLGCKYVALSYVWGKSTSVEKTSCSGQGRGLLETAPQTIQDAAKLTRELGYHIWWKPTKGVILFGIPCGEQGVGLTKRRYVPQKCIIFTTKETMFQCKNMFCRETVCHVDQRDIFAVSAKKDPPDMWDHIEEYSQRDLTYDSDALNGILGIFRQYRMNKTPVYHFWGIPFSASNSHSSAEEQFLASLCWLSWPQKHKYHHVNRFRRADFPSWSWTGWQHDSVPFFTDGRKPFNITGSISVQCSNDSSVSRFEEFYEQRIKTDSWGDSTKFLIVDCWTVELDVKIPRLSPRAILEAPWSSGALAWPVNKHGQEEDNIVATALSLEDVGPDSNLNTDSSGIQEPHWLALVFEDIEAFRLAGGFHEGMGIVVRRYGDYYERVGNIKLDNDDRLCRVSRSKGDKVMEISSPLGTGDSSSDPDANSEPDNDDASHSSRQGELTLEDWLPSEFIWRKIKLG